MLSQILYVQPFKIFYSNISNSLCKIKMSMSGLFPLIKPDKLKREWSYFPEQDISVVLRAFLYILHTLWAWVMIDLGTPCDIFESGVFLFSKKICVLRKDSMAIEINTNLGLFSIKQGKHQWDLIIQIENIHLCLNWINYPTKISQ